MSANSPDPRPDDSGRPEDQASGPTTPDAGASAGYQPNPQGGYQQGGYQQGGYQQGGQGYNQPGYGYAPPGPQTNTMAILTLVFGIAGLTVLFGVGGVVAVILGPMAKRQIAERGEGGEGLATAGIVMGWIGIVLSVLILVVAVVVPLLFIVTAGTAAGLSTAG